MLSVDRGVFINEEPSNDSAESTTNSDDGALVPPDDSMVRRMCFSSLSVELRQMSRLLAMDTLKNVHKWNYCHKNVLDYLNANNIYIARYYLY